MIEITFTADNVQALMFQVRQFLDGPAAGMSAADHYANQRAANGGALAGPPESAKTVEAPKAAKAKKSSPRPPVAETEAIEASPIDAPENDPEPEVEQPVLNDTIADEKVKAEVIRTLQSIYNSGKVQVIRHVLAKYGGGAKSFPEIEASRFPAIREALASGEIA